MRCMQDRRMPDHGYILGRTASGQHEAGVGLAPRDLLGRVVADL